MRITDTEFIQIAGYPYTMRKSIAYGECPVDVTPHIEHVLYDDDEEVKSKLHYQLWLFFVDAIHILCDMIAIVTGKTSDAHNMHWLTTDINSMRECVRVIGG